MERLPYYNIAVALHHINNGTGAVSAGFLQFDPGLPHAQGRFHLSTLRHPELISRFDAFLAQHRAAVVALQKKYAIEVDGSSEFVGLEQWKIDFIKRKREKDRGAANSP